MPGRLRAFGRRLARLARYSPLRLPGLVLLGAGLAVALRVGKAQADYLLYPAGLAAVGLVAVCLLTVALAVLVLRRALRRLPGGLLEDMQTQVATHTSFRFPRLRAWPVVEVTMSWDTPAGVTVALEPAGRWFEETVTPSERGRHARVVRRFTVADIFGLTALSFRVAWNEPLRIAPLIAHAGAELASSHAHGDAFSHPSGRAEGDLVEMRAYGHGDPLRHVLWKTFARTRRLLVRMPERAIAPRPVTAAAFVAGDGDEPAAAVARLYLERGMFGRDFIFSADGAGAVTGQTHEALEQIIDSAAARAKAGQACDALERQVETARLASCVIFAPPIDGPWRERVTAFSRRLPAPATLVIGIDGVPGTRAPLVRRLLLLAPAANGAVTPAGLPALRAALEADGMRVQVVHRVTGQVL